MQLPRQFGHGHVGGVDLKVVFGVGVGGSGAAAVYPGKAVTPRRLPTGALLVRYVHTYQPNLVAGEHAEQIQQPVTRPDQVIGDDVDALVQESPDLHKPAIATKPAPNIAQIHGAP